MKDNVNSTIKDTVDNKKNLTEKDSLKNNEDLENKIIAPTGSVVIKKIGSIFIGQLLRSAIGLLVTMLVIYIYRASSSS
jgi:hypothetical protein